MWMPDWLYERLPLLYLVASGVCLWVLGISFATAISALLLFAAGLLTYTLRRSARRRVTRRLPRRSSKR
jgi:MprA protease rhombosortase-interaction domain-containing protein